ncbi:hypothetical protein PENSPDRAFT_752581 [Peniophora sp. CONT]|nr:hypothetical protein PENSPDRAFT_752581 [Peniophora sp. CONT]
MISYSCAICLNDWPHTETLRSLSCGHTFCEACITQHLSRAPPLCPSCRAGPVKRHHIRPVYISADTRDGPASTSTRDRATGVPLELLPKLHQVTLDLLSLTPDAVTDPSAVSDSILDLLASKQCNEAVKTVLIGTFTAFLESNVASAYELVRDLETSDGQEAGRSTAKRQDKARAAYPLSQPQVALNAVAQAQIQALIKENNQLRQENIALLLDQDPA